MHFFLGTFKRLQYGITCLFKASATITVGLDQVGLYRPHFLYVVNQITLFLDARHCYDDAILPLSETPWVCHH